MGYGVVALAPIDVWLLDPRDLARKLYVVAIGEGARKPP
jgi:hypothetical protein